MGPEIPESVLASDLDRAARGRLRTLSKDNADGVARHLVMAGRLIDDDPELAYEHAQAAVRRAGRVDVVREAAALTAYRTGRYAEALRELRTVRRLNGSDEHLALMADCERGLGRPDRALVLAQDDAARALPAETQVELAIVVSGARLDLGDPDAALAALSTPVVRAAAGELAERVAEARAGALEAAGRSAEARELLAALPAGGPVDEEVIVFDLEDDESSGVATESEPARSANGRTSDHPDPDYDVNEGSAAVEQDEAPAPLRTAEVAPELFVAAGTQMDVSAEPTSDAATTEVETEAQPTAEAARASEDEPAGEKESRGGVDGGTSTNGDGASTDADAGDARAGTLF